MSVVGYHNPTSVISFIPLREYAGWKFSYQCGETPVEGEEWREALVARGVALSEVVPSPMQSMEG